jgi:hypothetical protein
MSKGIVKVKPRNVTGIGKIQVTDTTGCAYPQVKVDSLLDFGNPPDPAIYFVEGSTVEIEVISNDACKLTRVLVV